MTQAITNAMMEGNDGFICVDEISYYFNGHRPHLFSLKDDYYEMEDYFLEDGFIDDRDQVIPWQEPFRFIDSSKYCEICWLKDGYEYGCSHLH